MSSLGEPVGGSCPPTCTRTVVTLVLTVILILSVAYLTLWERKVIGWMQMRIGPNRVRIFGFSAGHGSAVRRCHQAADQRDRDPGARQQVAVPRWRPAITLIPAFAAWAVVPIAPQLRDRQCRCRPAVRAVADLDGRLRRDPRRLGVELQVRLPGRDALGGADGRLRDRDGLCAGRGADGLAAA